MTEGLTPDFSIVRAEAEDRSTLAYEVQPPIPLSRYGEVVLGADKALQQITLNDVEAIRPATLSGLQERNRISITPEEDSSVVRWTFFGNTPQGPASTEVRRVLDEIVSDSIHNL